MFGFYAMNGKQRDTYLTRVRNKKVCELMNQPGYGDEFDDKLRFNVRFADFLGRRTLNAAAATPDELSAFLQGSTASSPSRAAAPAATASKSSARRTGRMRRSCWLI